MNYKKEAERWQKHYDDMPFKNGLYAPLFKRSEHESDEEYVKHCEEISTLMCSVILYSEAIKYFNKTLKYIDKTYSDWADNQILKLMKLDLEIGKTQEIKNE